MTTANFTINCVCCPNEGPLMTVSNASLDAWKAVIAKGQIQNVTCECCGCCYNPADNGPVIGTADVSKPRIDSLSPVSGPVVGGATVTLRGHALDFGQVVVKFNGVPAINPRNASDTSLVVTAPAGSYALLGSSVIQRKLACTMSGTFQIGNRVKGTSSEVLATIREVGGNFLYVDAWTGEFQPGEPLVEQVELGATGSVVAFKPSFQTGETVTGQTSGANAELQMGYRVGVPTGVFQGGEVVKGGTSEAKITLANPPTDGRIDVTVENQFGKRDPGGTLAKGFTYS